jgi:hypothetical protein
VHRTAREAKEQKALDRSEAELPALGATARAGEVSEQPGELGGAEIGVEEEAGLVPDHGLEPRSPQALAVGRRAAVLPDDGVREQPPAVPLPEEGRLPLIADPDRGDLAPADAVLGEHPTGGPDLGLPEKLRIVLDPAGLRIDLWMLLLGHAGGPHARRRGVPASWSCLGRGRGDSA